MSTKAENQLQADLAAVRGQLAASNAERDRYKLALMFQRDFSCYTHAKSEAAEALDLNKPLRQRVCSTLDSEQHIAAQYL